MTLLQLCQEAGMCTMCRLTLLMCHSGAAEYHQAAGETHQISSLPPAFPCILCLQSTGADGNLVTDIRPRSVSGAGC